MLLLKMYSVYLPSLGFTIENELSRKCFTSKSISIYLHFRFLTFLLCDFFISLFVLLPFHFVLQIYLLLLLV